MTFPKQRKKGVAISKSFLWWHGVTVWEGSSTVGLALSSRPPVKKSQIISNTLMLSQKKGWFLYQKWHSHSCCINSLRIRELQQGVLEQIIHLQLFTTLATPPSFLWNAEAWLAAISAQNWAICAQNHPDWSFSASHLSQWPSVVGVTSATMTTLREWLIWKTFTTVCVLVAFSNVLGDGGGIGGWGWSWGMGVEFATVLDESRHGCKIYWAPLYIWSEVIAYAEL